MECRPEGTSSALSTVASTLLHTYEEEVMFILDVPLQTAQMPTVAYLGPDQISGGQLNASDSSGKNGKMPLQVCYEAGVFDGPTPGLTIDPLADLKQYFAHNNRNFDHAGAIAGIVSQPKHGEIVPSSDIKTGSRFIIGRIRNLALTSNPPHIFLVRIALNS
jgi:hypothetical protein